MNKLVAGITSLRVRSASKHAAVAAIGVATLTLFGMNANATSIADAPTQKVDFKDLDLSKQADAKRLYRRLQMAAGEVCIGYPIAEGLRNSPRARCEQAAVTHAVETIAHPNLTALHVAKADVKLAQSKAKSLPNT
jgi:UrcA family protein